MPSARVCLVCGRIGSRGFRPADNGRDGYVCVNDAACARRGESWMYGFYDSADERRVVYWYVYGFLTHATAESARHTGAKSTWGQPVVVRRKRNGSADWEHVDDPPGSGEGER